MKYWIGIALFFLGLEALVRVELKYNNHDMPWWIFMIIFGMIIVGLDLFVGGREKR